MTAIMVLCVEHLQGSLLGWLLAIVCKLWPTAIAELNHGDRGDFFDTIFFMKPLLHCLVLISSMSAIGLLLFIR